MSHSKFHSQSQRKKIKAPYLGKISLYWCTNCNVPLLDNYPCNICDKKGFKTSISPPGDVRPAFEEDYLTLRKCIDKQFGRGVGFALFPTSKIVLINRIGGLDRTEEVILDGKVIGICQFNILSNEFEFIPKIIGGIFIFNIQKSLDIPLKKHIKLNADGIEYTLKGKSILAPGVESFSNDIHKKDICLVIARNSETNEHQCIAIASAREDSKNFHEMLKKRYGEFAKNKSHLKTLENYQSFLSTFKNVQRYKQSEEDNEKLNTLILKTLKKAYKANYSILNKEIQKSIKFIKKTIKDIQKPVAVAYSGGKDSLGVLLLVWKVLGPKFKIFFADTGLELPEVLENVHKIAEVLHMDSNLIIESAGDIFWELIESFGPPGRDYRFCCHSLKAQNIMKIIKTMYNGEKVLVFLGQRQYESLNRMRSKQIYVNSFIPLQIAATPIKSWNALTLWLFILFEPVKDFESENLLDVPITSLYFKGHERLGCYLCPSSNLSNFKLLKSSHPEMYAKWFSFLNSYAQKYNLPKEWVQYGLWRFKQYTPQWKNFVDSLNISIDYDSPDSSAPLNLIITKGFSQNEESDFSIKGKFTQPINFKNLIRFLPAMAKDIHWDNTSGMVQVASIYKTIPYTLKIYEDGSFVINSTKQEFDFYKIIKILMGTLLRTLYCNNCKTCISVCTHQAIQSTSDGISIDEKKCINCFECITHCPFSQLANKTMSNIKFL